MHSYFGQSQLKEFLNRSEILVCLLPRTSATDNFLNNQTFAQLPSGACLVNCGRGEPIDDDALLEAVRSGHIAGAVLDVFRTEPLPPEHPFWDEPNITVTPHCASKPNPATASLVILKNIEKMKKGEPIEGIVNRKRAY